ncbi:hypothetical protein D3C87_486070 [compost metagenome]
MKKKKYDLTSIFITVLIIAFLYSIFIFTYSLLKLEKLSFSHELDFANMDKYSSYLQGIVGLFINLVTIILVYRTFKQQDDFIVEQRKEIISTKKSEVFFPDKEINFFDKIEDGEWLVFLDEKKEPSRTINSKILNIGKSNCKNIKIEWNYSLEEIFKIIDDPNISLYPHLKAYKIEVNNYIVSIPSNSEFFLSENIDYLLTFENMPSGRDIRFPIEYLELFIFYWQKKLFSDRTFNGFKLGSNECFSPLTLAVTYEDGVERRNIDIYSVNCSIRYGYFRNSENTNSINIEFQKK